MMDNSKRRDEGLLYISDEKVFEEQKRSRRLTHKMNTMDSSDFDGIQKVAKELLSPESGDVFINPPFRCDYGDHITIGKGTFINYNCTILDTGKVSIGTDCMFGPNVSLYAAGHPLHPATRNTLYEYGRDVTIGNNVWLGGNVVVCPGVTIGDNCVIGAGSVVTKDIPAWSLAVGNPCRVIRTITEADRKIAWHKTPVDDAAWQHMQRIWDEEKNDVKYPHAPKE